MCARFSRQPVVGHAELPPTAQLPAPPAGAPDRSVTSIHHRSPAIDSVAWRSELRRAVLAAVAEFVATRSASQLDESSSAAAGEILLAFVSSGKCLRSTFMYLGWLCGAEPSAAALSAAASLELLHAFALVQDDVMDRSAQRRGRPAVHVQLAEWYRHRGMSGSADRFGESAAILLGDVCLIWAEQMLRESGVAPRRLQQLWPRYDAMRIELAVGQFADLANDIRDLPPLRTVLDIARRKSGNYTVRRPLEMGAAMADCDDRTLAQLGLYGSDVGEAFQLRDDLLGVFGPSATTGKPNGGDLVERKATSVVVAAHEMADPPARRELAAFARADELDGAALDRLRTLIIATGAAQRIEDMIWRRIERARKILNHIAIDDTARAALGHLADACVERST